jgi:comEA protein
MYRLATRTVVLVALIVGAQAWLAAQKASPTKGAGNAAPAVINLNTATAEQLDSLPGIGAKVAARIIEYRQKNGPFRKIEDLMNVRGIGEKAFLKMKNRLSVGPTKPAAPNGQ